MIFEPFQFYFPVLFGEGYCSLPDFFHKMVVVFGAPYWVQSYLIVREDDFCPVFVMVNSLRIDDLNMLDIIQGESLARGPKLLSMYTVE